MNPELDEPAFEKPKIDLTLEMEKLNVGLTNTQFDNLIKLGDAMNRQQLGVPYRKYRPHNIRKYILAFSPPKQLTFIPLYSRQGTCEGMVALCHNLYSGGGYQEA